MFKRNLVQKLSAFIIVFKLESSSQNKQIWMGLKCPTINANRSFAPPKYTVYKSLQPGLLIRENTRACVQSMERKGLTKRKDEKKIQSKILVQYAGHTHTH